MPALLTIAKAVVEAAEAVALAAAVPVEVALAAAVVPAAVALAAEVVPVEAAATPVVVVRAAAQGLVRLAPVLPARPVPAGAVLARPGSAEAALA